MKLEDLVTSVAQGNIGALSFIVALLKTESLVAYPLLEMCHNNDVKGEKLYIIFSDECEKDLDRTCRALFDRFIAMQQDGTFKK